MRSCLGFLVMAVCVSGCSRGCGTTTARGTPSGEDASARAASSGPENGAGLPLPHPIPMRDTATLRHGIFTNLSAGALAPKLEHARIATLLGAQHCGDEATCGRVRAFLTSKEGFSVEARPLADWKMPPRSKVVPRDGLTQKNVDDAFASTSVVVVSATGPRSMEYLPLRAGLGAAAALANEFGVAVMDAETDRFESISAFEAHAVTGPFGENPYRSDRVVVESTLDSEGHAHFTFLGMARFGMHDLSFGPTMTTRGPLVFSILDEVARSIVGGDLTAPLDIAGGRVDLVRVPPSEGERAARLSVVPSGGANVPSYEALFAANVPKSDRGASKTAPVLEEANTVAAKKVAAQARLAALTQRFAHLAESGASVLVLLPFAADGGPTEAMWIEVTALEPLSVRGTLTNDPISIPNLRKGARVERRTEEVIDVLVTNADGTHDTQE